MAFYFVQFLTGLASAASLFLVASGLSIIFGVTRIVNFAHGAFYMLGAYVAFTLTEQFSGAFGFWGGVVVAALVVAAVGVLVEMVLLRRIYHAPVYNDVHNGTSSFGCQPSKSAASSNTTYSLTRSISCN